MNPDHVHDVIVCGGGPAGLSAALWLGRYRRKVLLLDAGEQRNRAAQHSHGYLTRDYAAPGELLEAGRKELERYGTVVVRAANADSATKTDDGFVLTVDGEKHLAQRVVLATGVEDEFPEVPGFKELYGKWIFHCPCCDGYDACDEEVLAIGWGEHVSGYALDLLEWGAKVVVVTGGRPFEGGDACSVALRRHEVDVYEEEVASFEIEDGHMTGAILSSGRRLQAQKAFFSIAHKPRTGLAESLGCRLDELGYIAVDDHGATSVEGVYAAGDVTPGEQMVQAAAAEGMVAGIACAQSLRGGRTAPGAPDPGPDPETELEMAQRAAAGS